MEFLPRLVSAAAAAAVSLHFMARTSWYLLEVSASLKLPLLK